MQANSLTHALREHALVQDLDDNHVNALIDCATDERFREGEYLWRQGDSAEAFYLIRDGEVSLGITVPNEGSIHIETVAQGEVLGWSWMFPPYRWHFDARATKTVRAFALDACRLRERCQMDTQLHYELLIRLMPVIGDRLDATRRKLVDLYVS